MSTSIAAALGQHARRRPVLALLVLALVAGSTVALQPAFAAASDYDITIADAVADEGDASTPIINLPVTVTRNTPAGPSANETVTITYETEGSSGTAMPAAAPATCSSAAATPDYLPATDSVTVTFTPTDVNNAKKTVNVPVEMCGDVVDEPDETFVVAISSTDGTVSDNLGTATIRNDDDPEVSVLETQTEAGADVPFKVLEGTGGSTVFQVPIVLSNPSNEDITVTYQTADGDNPTESPPPATQPQTPATELPLRNAQVSDGDYEPLSGQVVFPKGATRKDVRLAIAADSFDEYDEELRFTIGLDAASGERATITDSTAIVTIVNDDDPTFTVGAAQAAEGSKAQQEGNKNNVVSFPITMRGPSNEEVKLTYITRSGTARGGVDFVEVPATQTKSQRTVIFPKGEGTASVDIKLIGDDVTGEGNETFQLIVDVDTKDKGTAGRLNARPSQVTAVGTILDDDQGPPTIGFPRPGTDVAGVVSCDDHDQQDPADPTDDIFAVCLSEGQDGQVTPFTFPVVLSHPSQDAVSVEYATADGTSTSKTGDYEVATGTVRFEPGAMVKTIVVDALGDRFPGPNEHFFVRLSAPTGGTMRAASTLDPDPTSARAVVLNDDGPVIESEDTLAAEPATNRTSKAAFVLTLSEKAPTAVSVAYATASGTARAGSDFVARQGTATIPAGSLRAEIPITILGDDVIEGDETFTLQLSDAVGGTLRRAKVTATIQDQGSTTRARALDLACPSDEVPSRGFTDITGPTHELAIDCLAWWEITAGRTADSYDPGGVVTRGQMASYIARSMTAAGVTLPAEPPNHFRDDDGSPHELAIDQLTEMGVVSGNGDGGYGASDPINRAQTASLAARAYQVITTTMLPAGEDAFRDDDNAHEDNINRVAAAGIVTGRSGGVFDAGASTTRAQMASIVMRMMDLLVDEEFAATPAPPPSGPDPSPSP